VPAPPEADGLFALDAAGLLTLQGGWSPTSGRTHFPLAPVCPYTGADDVEARALPRDGSLWLWTAVTAAPPGYHGPVPFGLGIVELSDGLRVIGRLTVADPASLVEGMAMEVVADELPDSEGGTVTTWAFAPSGAPTAGATVGPASGAAR
jgi:uncharacterized OB-fold protein